MFTLSHLVQNRANEIFRVFYWNSDENIRLYIPEGEALKHIEKIETELGIPEGSVDISLSTEIMSKDVKTFTGPHHVPMTAEEVTLLTEGSILCRSAQFFGGSVSAVYMRFLGKKEREYLKLMTQRAHHLIYNELWGILGFEDIAKVNFKYSTTEDFIKTAELEILCTNMFSDSLSQTLVDDWIKQRHPGGCEVRIEKPHVILTVKDPTGCPVMTDEEMDKIICSYIMKRDCKYNVIQLLKVKPNGHLSTEDINVSRAYNAFLNADQKREIEKYLLNWQEDMQDTTLCELVTIDTPRFCLYPLNATDYDVEAVRKMIVEWKIPYKLNGLVTKTMLRQYIEENIAEITKEFGMETQVAYDDAYYAISKSCVDVHDEVIDFQLTFSWSDPGFGELPF